MDDVDGLRLKLSSEDSVSLASSLTDPINLEDSHYARLRGELESDAQNLEAESWSVAVEQSYLKTLNKEAVKRQDVIYELIQTEMHHVRTLKILLHVYVHELRQSQLIEEGRLERLFPRVETLLTFHQHFLNCLKARQNQSQEEGSPNNYQITQLGDILISQFSDALGEGMMECYSVFCRHHNEAISFYKEQLQSNKKLQILIRKLGQLPLVRRLGIPECFLLVTQRITKYPVLVERIIQNTEADTDEHKSLVQGLERIKDTISEVNDQVSEYEKFVRLREIGLRLEPKSQGRQKDGQLFRREDLIQGNGTLLREGAVTWKSSGRQKDIHAVLLSDVLLLLQEKDQKLVFAAVDNKPPVISLQRLIVREVAHEDKAMFLICACTTSLPEMYEIHTGSREDRITWTALIRQAVEHYPQKELQRELIAKLQHCQDALKERDDQIIQSLTEKQQIFAALYENAMEQETPHKGLLLRGDATDLQQGGALLKGAIDEVENLLNLLLSKIRDPDLVMDDIKMQGELLRRAETFGAGDSDSYENTMKNGNVAERPGSSEGSQVHLSHTTEINCPEGLEQSVSQADDETFPVPNCSSASTHLPEAEVYNKVMMLIRMLYSLKAVIAQQDSQIELQRAFQTASQQPARHYSNVLLEQEKQRNLEKQKAELANLYKLQAQHQEAQQRWEKERERQRIQIETLEAQVQQREEDCRKWEEKLNGEKAELETQRENYQQDLERLRESTKSVEKEQERNAQERERLEKLKSKYIPNPGHSNYDDPAQSWNLSSYPSFRGSIVNGFGNQTFTPKPITSNLMEIPPKVPPRKESISPQPVKPELPVHLISTTNQVHKPPAVHQKIPTKLATLPKGKEKALKMKGSHQRTHSAASIDVNQVLPIRVTGKEGGSLRAKRNGSPQRIYHSDTFKLPGSVHSVKMSQSFSTHKRSSNEAPPPAPPPFPKDVLEMGKEKVIFL
ncbi:rho guanine nucleotide exchange factor 18a isoform X1 [Seriola aureovittata]|uniref:rho guanine nucleotide exchange factor 18a isoform X1 n=1 Tax=Seriola aureovittata TaxID=2871759 RepID=UPI0024BE7595|nr:rho guanine nucleotide exchange factor 18a isoform X1 [Seriola aureovittata]XP_056246841.1 rho guanine nucleotide exchange factor 18a isoform X1 [Seriola aureovittata]